jgi:hypothetical protein
MPSKRGGETVEPVQHAKSGVDEKVLSKLAEQFRAKRVASRGYSPRFEYLKSARRFIVVAGDQDAKDTDLALAFGLTYHGKRRLTLVVPKGLEFSIRQRAPWFTREARPHIFTYTTGRAVECKRRTQQETIEEYTRRLKPGQGLEDELRAATAPAYLGSHSDSVARLVDWAVIHPQLDPAHRKGMRSWQCMGQRVLSIRRSAGGLAVTAGIHYTKDDQAPEPTVMSKGEVLSASQIEAITEAVNGAIRTRLTGAMQKPDEHWLQAVIRRDPRIVGVEQPALRELPAWRPHGRSDPAKRWGRGFIDLIGVDGNGDIRLVETKLAENSDDMLILQGLDYYLWAQAYLEILRERLGAPKRSRIIVHYVIGASPAGKLHLSKHAQAQVDSLAIPYRFQSVTNWFRPPGEDSALANSVLHAEGARLESWSS